MASGIASAARRALILAAKVAPVVVVIDASGCGVDSVAMCDVEWPCDRPDASSYGTGGHGPSAGGSSGVGGASTGGLSSRGDASVDSAATSDTTDASKDGG